MVLIREENLPPCKWLLGRVVKIYMGKDKKVRVVDIKTGKGVRVQTQIELADISPSKTLFRNIPKKKENGMTNGHLSVEGPHPSERDCRLDLRVFHNLRRVHAVGQSEFKADGPPPISLYICIPIWLTKWDCLLRKNVIC
ncbi:hypothetical protein TNCV_987261 [Trichonephila clavipes]|nr:hypothetical protein TNCV_987261 [Trichonephila clavipes]